jgi:hypothetical protein
MQVEPLFLWDPNPGTLFAIEESGPLAALHHEAVVSPAIRRSRTILLGRLCRVFLGGLPFRRTERLVT